MTDIKEDAELTSILKKPAFVGQEAVWKCAYAHYRKACGDPWILSPAVFSVNLVKEQLALYDNRKNGGPITRIRQTVGILCCPMCGSPTIGTLDHYLPRDEFPEFSVLPCNLVPACGLCNSGAKGKTFKGTAPPERFLHPYFETTTEKEIWQILVQPPYAAATFLPTASPTVPSVMLAAVQFHLANVFGPAFHTQMATYWSTMADEIREHVDDLGFTYDQAWAFAQKTSDRSFAVNGWRSALIRGIITDPAARAYVDGLAAKPKSP
ncbi:HNH endonuclease [Glacieibacterium frigidum]|uniref:HNH endonuclease n=1 Tax=Glacieibacterium frigidum TaxID=2593303 RepID=A0A552UHN1_9SPHN|nr:hypothetical protein [Glacieibacterium frigidum]TRW17729.1 hypothetical protein FMM06_06225 [Glacieibacterium frigidum]